MGLIKKAATFTAFKISGELPSLTELKNFIAKAPSPSISGTSAPEAFSFCSLTDVFEKGVTQGEATLGFGVRQDKKTISKSLFKKKYKEALKAKKDEARKSKQKITKEDKQLLAENIRGELYAEVEPIEKHFEALWDTRNGMIYFGSATPKILDGFISLLMKHFPEATISMWNPVGADVKHIDAKGSRDNFQNAFLTWVFYKTKTEQNKLWTLNVKFLDTNDTAITIKGDAAASMEPYLAILHSRMVDSIDLGYSTERENKDKVEYEVSVKRGPWAFKGLKIKPEIGHENLDAAVFERAASFKEFSEHFEGLVKEYEAIRKDDTAEKNFWAELRQFAENKVKTELENQQ